MTDHERLAPPTRRGTARAVQRAADRAEATGSSHPLLDLQQQAGNRAVAQLARLQRHAVDPQDEGGDV